MTYCQSLRRGVDNLVIVKEDVHIYEGEKRVLFLGCEVNSSEAKKYLGEDFQPEMLIENPKLFHVEHALKGTDLNPVATWKMVRLSKSTLEDSEEANIIAHIKTLVESSKGINIYLKTLEIIEKTKLSCS